MPRGVNDTLAELPLAAQSLRVPGRTGMFGSFGAAPAAGPFPSFGQPQATPNPFGAAQPQQQQPLFGFGGQQQQQQQQQQQAGATPGGGLFGAATSSPLFGVAPAASGGLFGGAQQQQQQQQPGGGQQLGFFGAAQGTTGQAAGGGLFGGGLQVPALGAAFAQPGVPRSDVVLTTKTGGPVTHATKWEDLSPEAQAKLLSLECVVCCAPHSARACGGLLVPELQCTRAAVTDRPASPVSAGTL